VPAIALPLLYHKIAGAGLKRRIEAVTRFFELAPDWERRLWAGSAEERGSGNCLLPFSIGKKKRGTVLTLQGPSQNKVRKQKAEEGGTK